MRRTAVRGSPTVAWGGRCSDARGVLGRVRVAVWRMSRVGMGTERVMWRDVRAVLVVERLRGRVVWACVVLVDASEGKLRADGEKYLVPLLQPLR